MQLIRTWREKFPQGDRRNRAESQRDRNGIEKLVPELSSHLRVLVDLPRLVDFRFRAIPLRFRAITAI
jgi:hypothetical protein